MPVDIANPEFAAFHKYLIEKADPNVVREILETIHKNVGSITLDQLAVVAHSAFFRDGKMEAYYNETKKEKPTVRSFGHDVQHMISEIQQTCFDLFCEGKNPRGFVIIENPTTSVRCQDDDLSTHHIDWQERLEDMRQFVARQEAAERLCKA